MDKIKDYTIVACTNTQSLIMAVCGMIQNGWQPQGGAFASGLIVAQTMVKIEEPVDDVYIEPFKVNVIQDGPSAGLLMIEADHFNQHFIKDWPRMAGNGFWVKVDPENVELSLSFGLSLSRHRERPSWATHVAWYSLGQRYSGEKAVVMLTAEQFERYAKLDPRPGGQGHWYGDKNPPDNTCFTQSNMDCFGPRPAWATHVVWFPGGAK